MFDLKEISKVLKSLDIKFASMKFTSQLQHKHNFQVMRIRIRKISINHWAWSQAWRPSYKVESYRSQCWNQKSEGETKAEHNCTLSKHVKTQFSLHITAGQLLLISGRRLPSCSPFSSLAGGCASILLSRSHHQNPNERKSRRCKHRSHGTCKCTWCNWVHSVQDGRNYSGNSTPLWRKAHFCKWKC